MILKRRQYNFLIKFKPGIKYRTYTEDIYTCEDFPKRSIIGIFKIISSGYFHERKYSYTLYIHYLTKDEINSIKFL